MPEEIPDGAAANESPPLDGPTDLEIIEGSTTIEIELHNGSKDKVKVLLLTVRQLEVLSELNMESDIAEHYCGKRETKNAWNLRNTRALEDRLLQLLPSASIDQVEAIEKRLDDKRHEIEALEAREKWADSLSLESVIKIVETGERINRPRLRRWAETQMKLTGARKMLLTESILKNSSPSSEASSTKAQVTS